jgi:hypothetical protein
VERRNDQDAPEPNPATGLSDPPLARPTTARWPVIPADPETARTLSAELVAAWDMDWSGVRPIVEVRKGATTFAVSRISEAMARNQESTLTNSRIAELSDDGGTSN